MKTSLILTTAFLVLLSTNKLEAQELLKPKGCNCSKEYKPDKQCKYAIDGNASTEWISGGFAPQWICVDFESFSTDVSSPSISKISFVNNMSPEGSVSIEFKFFDSHKQVLSTFTRDFYLRNGETTSLTFPEVKFVSSVKVTVTKSPSWVSFKEISFYGDDNPVGSGSEIVEMVFVRGGTYRMGDSIHYALDFAEKPHYVTLNDFYIGKYEITLGQFKKFIDETGYRTYADKHGGSWVVYGEAPELRSGVNWQCDIQGKPRSQSNYNYPVGHICWDDAVAYCEWLSLKTGYNYRLPTEAEWEYAARGGGVSNGYQSVSGGLYASEVAWYGKNSGNETHPVGQKKPNELGIYNMSGNIEEWCNDWYDEKYYNNSPSSNPKGPAHGKERVVRGGFWGGDLVTITDRCSRPPSNRFGGLGFRVVRTD